MSYEANPVTAGERGSVYALGWMGLFDAVIALGFHLAGSEHQLGLLFTVFASSLLFAHALNFRARDEFFDRLVLAGARWALATLGLWITLAAMLALFLRSSRLAPAPVLDDLMVASMAVATAYFAGFCFARHRAG